MTISYISILLTQIVENKRNNGLKIFINFMHNKYGELPNLDITTFMVSFSCGKHWSVYLFSGLRIFSL